MLTRRSLLTGTGLAVLLSACGSVSAAPPGADSAALTIPHASPVDPGAWGGYQNGRIPLDQMQELTFNSNKYLRPDAAAALERLNAAYERHFGTDIGPVDAYRDMAAQQACYDDKPGLCAKPGTSNHGWGLAVDLDGGGINDYGTPEHDWMEAHAGRFGWLNPPWAQADGEKPEPWHWQYKITD